MTHNRFFCYRVWRRDKHRLYLLYCT